MLWWNRRTWIWVSLLFMLLFFSIRGTGIDLSQFLNISNLYEFIVRSWLPPDWSILPYVWMEALVTVKIAFLGTIFALMIALPISFLAARNLMPAPLYTVVRTVLSFFRTIPEIVLGLIFVVVVGLGPFPAVLAIFIHNTGVLGKLISELVESADRGPQEALRSAGAPTSAVALYAILPQIWPNIISHYFYRLEVAIRTSLILGLIGAGGIGQQLYMHFKLFQYDKVTVDILCLMALVIVVDFISARIRAHVLGK
jgi:phosphonate transport system permease protein